MFTNVGIDEERWSVPWKVRILSEDCAGAVYHRQHPASDYADSVAKLLYMTAAHESGGFRWRRQIGYGRFDDRGAFGLWQIERPTIEAIVKYVRHPDRHELYERSESWLGKYDKDFPDLNLSAESMDAICVVVQDARGDPLSCLLARLFYLRFPEPVPSSDRGRAAYAKRFYNTHLGKATVENYYYAFKNWWPEDAD